MSKERRRQHAPSLGRELVTWRSRASPVRMRIKNKRPEPLICGVLVILGVPKKIDGDLWQLHGMADVSEVEWRRHFFCQALRDRRHHVGRLKNMTNRDEMGDSKAYASFL